MTYIHTHFSAKTWGTLSTNPKVVLSIPKRKLLKGKNAIFLHDIEKTRAKYLAFSYILLIHIQKKYLLYWNFYFLLDLGILFLWFTNENGTQWYFLSLEVTDKTFQLMRSVFSLHVEMFFLLGEQKANLVIKSSKHENWRTLSQLKGRIKIPRDGTWLFKSKQTLFYFEN